MEGFTREASLKEVLSLAPKLRAADVAEILATSGMQPSEALQRGYAASSIARVIVIGGQLVGTFGAVPDHDGNACVWMVATDELRKGRRVFLQKCRQEIDSFPYPLLYGWTDARNTLHHKWLRWCGFTFINRLDAAGAEGRPFLHFVRIQPCATQ